MGTDRHNPSLDEARLHLLRAMYPDWHIWQGRHNRWHAIRKGAYMEHRGEQGSVLPFSLHNDNPTCLARDLGRWEATAAQVRARHRASGDDGN